MSDTEPILGVHDVADGEVQAIESVCEDVEETEDESARLSITERNKGTTKQRVVGIYSVVNSGVLQSCLRLCPTSLTRGMCFISY
jgi:hypothetical protein